MSLESEQNGKKKEDLDADDENIGEEDSQFMKLAKKVTAKTLQKKGLITSSVLFCWSFPIKMAATVQNYTSSLALKGRRETR